MSKKYIVANHKMYLAFSDMLQWYTDHLLILSELARNSYFITCPDFTTVAAAKELLKKTDLIVGAQDCSPWLEGAYTGAVSARSLAHAGCQYVIIGHSEVQKSCGEPAHAKTQKVQAAREAHLKPIVCFGETAEERSAGKTLEVLKRQIAEYEPHNPSDILWAYEPLWAIGTNTTPSFQEINAVFEALKIEGIYGGSVTADLAQELQKAPNVVGFLLGRASIDIQALKNIVGSV